MEILNQEIEKLSYTDLRPGETIYIKSSKIKEVNFDTTEFYDKVVIENCTIGILKIHACWFHKGLLFRNNRVQSYVDYQMGGHNKEPILLEGNTFCDFFNFFDCHFEAILEVKGNTFTKGSNLFGNQEEGYRNTFENGFINEKNIGDLFVPGFEDQ